MTRSTSFQSRMSNKLIIFCLFIVLVFGANIGIMISAFSNIKGLTNTIITRDVDGIIQNAQMTRDLSAIFNETSLLLSTFYHNENVLEEKSGVLLEGIDGILIRDMDKILRHNLNEFRESLTLLFNKCAGVNGHYNTITQTNRKLQLLLTDLEEYISQKIINLVLAGDDPRAYELIGALIPSYRESFLQITLVFISIDPVKANEVKIQKITELLDNIRLRLRTLLASDSKISDYGNKLLEHAFFYQKSINDFQAERIALYKRFKLLGSVKEKNLATMKSIDNKTVNAVQLMKDDINQITSSSVNTVLIISALVALFAGMLIYFFLHYHIRRPMELIRFGMLSVSEGNLDTIIHLERKDEWNILETTLNKMILDLKNSYSKLQTNNEELKKMNNEAAYNLSELEKEIQQRANAEEKSHKLEQQLQHAQKMEAIGTLAGGVAHDLNNILTGVVSYPDLLLMKMPADSQYRKPIKIIQESGKKAAAIVEDLLTLARRGVAVKDQSNLNDLISEYLTAPEYKKMISYHPQVNVKLDLDADLQNIEGSSFHLTQIIMNLISNGAESINGEGLIKITTENRTITDKFPEGDNLAVGDYAVLTISDTGEGISSHDLERIFEPFFTKKEMGRSGTGLGLAVVWGSVQDHNGHIDVQSIEGQGTTFTLCFPISKQGSTEKINQHTTIENFSGKGQSILVVDDLKIQREIASQMLVQLGYSVNAVSSGEEAVEYLKENSVDLLLLDMIMPPGIDGLDTYKRILEFKPNQRAIITSGYSETGRVKEAQRAGAKIYLKKPYTLQQVGVAIKKELG